MKLKGALIIAVCLLFISIIGNIYMVYVNIDQGYSLSYLHDGYTNTENDLQEVIDLYNNRAYTKEEIHEALKDHSFYEVLDFGKDTIELERVYLIFEHDQLQKVQKAW